MKKFIFILTQFVFISSSYGMFCPTNFNEINLGDSIERVAQVCGKPDKQKSYVDDSNVPQEWSYFVNGGSDFYNQAPTNFKLVVTLVNKKIINMTANGLSLSTTPLCNNKTLNLGDTMDKVTAACGKPVFVNKGSQAENAGPKIVEYQYNATPVTILTFENGKLKSREQF